MVFCSVHLPVGFQPDPLTGILYPSSITTPLTSLLLLSSRLSRVRSLLSSLHTEASRQLLKSHTFLQSLLDSVTQMAQRKQKPPVWNNTLNSLHCLYLSFIVLSTDCYSLALWTATFDGISAIQEIMTITLTALTPSPKPVTRSVPKPEHNPTPKPPVKEEVEPEEETPEETPEESVDEEEWKEPEEKGVEETPGRSHRTVTSRMLQRMKVGADDMLIRTRGNSHPVFINVTRLQQLIREEGGMLERDPFIAYLGSIPTSLFVTGTDYERALAASQRIVGSKSSSNSGSEKTEVVSEAPQPILREKWELLEIDQCRVKSFAKWFGLLGPVGRKMLPPKRIQVSRGKSPKLSDSLFIHEVTKFDGLSLRRSNFPKPQNPIEFLFSRLIQNRISKVLS